MALLELVKRQVIKTTQDDTFGDIYLELAEGALPINSRGITNLNNIKNVVEALIFASGEPLGKKI